MNLENKKQLATLALAIGLGFVAAFLTGQHIENSIKRQTKALSKQHEKKLKTELQRESKRMAQAMKSELDLMKKEMRKVAKEQSKMAKVTTKPPEELNKAAFSIKTPPGKRALTVLVDSLSAVGGLINPGDFVDIIGHLKIPLTDDPKEEKEKVSTVLFQNVQVLAVGTNFQPIGNAPLYDQQVKARSLRVTLAVGPEEALLLQFAQTNGKLQLTLRSPAEQESQIVQPASWEALADHVLENTGAELLVPRESVSFDEFDKKVKSVDDEFKPFIQIYRAGKEL